MLIVDTGPIVALLNRNDPDHKSCAELLESHNGELLITPYVLTEACYLLAKYVSRTRRSISSKPWPRRTSSRCPPREPISPA
ncbi:hypothetical protein GCM10017744_051070 [Streptomyces antimycoticus]|uniref:PIN domain-containing protein n=1 Tax=Streptomyces antimycoticus TaxID=68175 RepID=A0A4D4KBJ4_9ACTN|nr:hypothetical protein SANT12839_051220 [Streptomyces antimycoticus]